MVTIDDGGGGFALSGVAFQGQQSSNVSREDAGDSDAPSVHNRQLVQRRVKRGLDVCCALAFLVILSPLLVAIAAVIWFDSRGPILFRQSRLGLGGREFVMYKFRTMVPDCDPAPHRDYYSQLVMGVAAPDHGLFKLRTDPRVTRVGRFLRRFSLDELPQLVNVLRGTMSLVGPRPPIPYEVQNYGPREMLRLDVTPGLTGLWQVNGRNLMNFQDMITLDLNYIERWSIWLDLWILLRTPLAVLTAYGAD
jgi:lipopolysaccharide/colanic/teichoic acid biosynthesis glycosyltransferase